MPPISAHTHTTGLQLITLAASMYVIAVSIRTWAGHHPDNPAALGLVYGF